MRGRVASTKPDKNTKHPTFQTHPSSYKGKCRKKHGLEGWKPSKTYPLSNGAELQTKSPFLDQSDGLIKVGGRLDRADLTFGRRHPTLVPDTLTGDALIGYLHSKTEHQGRKITSAAIRDLGFCFIGGRSRISRITATRVPCRTLRTPTMTQKMADLPEQRL